MREQISPFIVFSVILLSFIFTTFIVAIANVTTKSDVHAKCLNELHFIFILRAIFTQTNKWLAKFELLQLKVRVALAFPLLYWRSDVPVDRLM